MPVGNALFGVNMPGLTAPAGAAGGVGANIPQQAPPPAPVPGATPLPGAGIANGPANVYGSASPDPNGGMGNVLRTGPGTVQGKMYGDPASPTFIAQESPVFGNFGQNVTQSQMGQQAFEKYSIANDVNYGDYQRFGQMAQDYGQQAGLALNDPRVAAAMQAQGAQAGGPSAGQMAAGGYQYDAMNQLGNAAAGNGPTAADIQGQQSISQAMRAQLTAANSAKGGAYAQSAAQQAAAQNAAGIQATGAGNAAALRAQEQQAAQAQYAQASGQAVQGANQAYTAQAQALQAYQQAAVGQQQANMGYYQSQQQALQHQSDIASNLASNQVANNYGLAGTQLQTQTQQHIADQQNQNSQIGMYAGIAAGVLSALSTGGAEAAAMGARAHGAPPAAAAQIGTGVGQQIGASRAGPQQAAAQRPADAMAALRGAGLGNNVAVATANLPGPETEPRAAEAYRRGAYEADLQAALGHLAKLRGGRRAGR